MHAQKKSSGGIAFFCKVNQIIHPEKKEK